MKTTNVLATILSIVALHSTAVAEIDAGYSGSWYNRDQSGHGLTLEYGVGVNRSHYLIVYWYLYDTNGNPIFLVGSSPPHEDTVEIDFEAPHGMIFGEFDPNSVVREDGGVGTFVFTDRDNGEFYYEPSQWMAETYGVSPVSMSIVKLADVAHPESDEEIAALQSQVNELQALLYGVTRGIDPNTGQDTLRFTDMNLQLVSGSGATDGVPTGTGNLIVGYNELIGDESDFRTGSHMLVIGAENNYTSFGGMVLGYKNTTSGSYSSVSGGSGNIASGNNASVGGGWENTASGWAASVSGGEVNIADGESSSVSGGYMNTTNGSFSSVSGGVDNVASGDSASVQGGESNRASGARTSVSGGLSKTATAQVCVVGDDGVDC
jgi:hypothetical protein